MSSNVPSPLASALGLPAINPCTTSTSVTKGGSHGIAYQELNLRRTQSDINQFNGHSYYLLSVQRLARGTNDK